MKTDLNDAIRARCSCVEPGACWVWLGARTGKGYGQISVDGKQRYVHRVMAESKFGPLKPGLCVRHRCDNPACCNPDHLTVCTPAENSRDMVLKGRSARGEKHHNATFSAEQVLAIRADKRKIPRIAEEYGVTYSAIQRIKRRETWRHL